MMHVCTIARGHTFPTTSGNPFGPSRTTKKVFLTPPIAQVGEHAHPELRALPTRASPQPQDVLLTGQGHPDRCVDGPVRDLPVTDLDHDRVNEDGP
jgi:hypothetical protein